MTRRAGASRGGVVLAAAALVVTSMAHAQTIPSDAKPTCVVAPAVFNGWFASGAVTLKGAVNPPDSAAFPGASSCSFYQWAKQMFLWLASQAPPLFDGGGRVFDTAAFFDVSPPDALGQRVLWPHTTGFRRELSVRAAQVNGHGLPFVFDQAGRMLEVEPPRLSPGGRRLIRDGAGNLVEVGAVMLARPGKVAFRDVSGKIIPLLAGPRPAAPDKKLARSPSPPIAVQRFTVGGRSVLVDLFGNIAGADPGPTDGGVLEARNGKLIYEVTIVNDVYAYLLTGLKSGGITPAPTEFPTTAADLDRITAFAAAHGARILDPGALAVEIKTSWIETADLAHLSSYITTTGKVPTYDTSNPTRWVQNGHRTVHLALVGIHIVGSAKGHPEMIWATFEHRGNTPNAAYSYRNTANALVSVPQTTAGDWLFSERGSTGPFNVAHMRKSPGTSLSAVAPHAIGPSDTIRWKPWGAASDASANRVDPTVVADSNTELISIHNGVLGMMMPADVRNDYVMIGATWTIGGAAPTSTNQAGTNRLANTTLETYQQGSSTGAAGSTNCFSCHLGNLVGVSHVFDELQPLF